MTTYYLPPQIDLTTQEGGQVVPRAPSISALVQTQSSIGLWMISAAVLPADTSGTSPVVGYHLYRGHTAQGPFTEVDFRLRDDTTVATLLYDPSPLIGDESFYVAVAMDARGLLSPNSIALSIAPHFP